MLNINIYCRNAQVKRKKNEKFSFFFEYFKIFSEIAVSVLKNNYLFLGRCDELFLPTPIKAPSMAAAIIVMRRRRATGEANVSSAPFLRKSEQKANKRVISIPESPPQKRA